MYMVLVLKCQKIDLYMEQSDLRMEGHLYGLCLKVSSNLYMEGHLNGLGQEIVEVVNVLRSEKHCMQKGSWTF